MKGWRNEQWQQNGNKRGGNGRWQQEAGIGVLLDFQWWWQAAGGGRRGRQAAGGGRADVQLNTNDIKKLYCRVIRASLENMAYLPSVP
jgi:hypothetical protein